MRCRIKICGVTSVADATAAARAGADAIGLNFYAPSPRCITEDTACDILRSLPPFIETVMLAVKETWQAALARHARLPGVGAVQMHGDTIEPCLPGANVRWVPAFPVRSADSLPSIETLLSRCRTNGDAMPAAVLVDAHVPGEYGGTGRTAPWDLLEGFDPGVPLILAGGLTPENVGDAVRRVRPYAVDVASGVESRPGVKDPEKLWRFVEAVRNAEQG
jgi:phosphoribosylanthranilate isomerase